MVSMIQTVLFLSVFQLCFGATVSDSSTMEDALHCQLLLPQNQELPWLRFLSDACTAHYQCNLHYAAVHCNEQFLKDMSDRCKDGFSDAFYDECQKSAADLYHKVVEDEEVNFLHSRSLKQIEKVRFVSIDEDRLFDECGTERINFTIKVENDSEEAESFKVTVQENGEVLFDKEFNDVRTGGERQVTGSTTTIVEQGAYEVMLEVRNSQGDLIAVATEQRNVPQKLARNFNGQIIEIQFDLFIESINVRVQNTGNTVGDYYIRVPVINKESERQQFCKGEEKTLSISLDGPFEQFELLRQDFIVELYVDPKDDTVKKVDSETGSYH